MTYIVIDRQGKQMDWGVFDIKEYALGAIYDRAEQQEELEYFEYCDQFIIWENNSSQGERS